ncbi:MAG: electron transfer flavoprotein subunit beta/FixA family protein [Chlorobium sp.]|nr:MAG: electron transfer flavoprotein subunit beta/FixA family protein [Chlorobium sp.]
MHIAVCLCQVPDTSSVIGFVDGTIDRLRVTEVMNPYDEYALEEAVRCKERHEGSQVTVFSVAPPSAKELLRKALAMGADRAVLVEAEVWDPYQIALALSRAISSFYVDALPDLVFCGKQSTDFQNGQVPPMLAELLGIASVSAITALTFSGECLKLEREIEGGIEYLEVTCPAVLSTEKGLNVPRKTSVKAVMEARKKPIDLLPLIIDEPPYVLMSGIKAAERKKICRFVQDEKELIRILGNERALF